MSNAIQETSFAEPQPAIYHEPIKPSRVVDLRKEFCPMTFVKFKLHMDQIGAGEILEVLLNPGEHMTNMPRNIHDHGHHIVAVIKEDNCYHLMVQKKG